MVSPWRHHLLTEITEEKFAKVWELAHLLASTLNLFFGRDWLQLHQLNIVICIYRSFRRAKSNRMFQQLLIQTFQKDSSTLFNVFYMFYFRFL